MVLPKTKARAKIHSHKNKIKDLVCTNKGVQRFLKIVISSP